MNVTGPTTFRASACVASLTFMLLTFCTGGQDTRITGVKTRDSASIFLRKDRQFTDRGWVDTTHYYVLVETFPSREFGIDCNPFTEKSPELSLDPEAERVAYRCTSTSPWRVHYLGKSRSRLFELCRTLPVLSWADVPSFESERLQLMKCATLDGAFSNRFKDILAESRDRGGDRSAADFLFEMINSDTQGVVDENGRDDWDTAYLALSNSVRQERRASLESALKSPPGVLAVYRALKFLDLSQQSVRALQDAAEYLVNFAEAPDDHRMIGARRSGLDIALRALAARDLPVAARLACRDAERFAANGQSVILPRIQLAAISAAKIDCNLDGTFDRNNCDLTFACCLHGFTCADSTRRACTEKDLNELVRLELSQPAQDPWKNGGGPGFELLLAAARARKSDSAKRFLERTAPAPACKR